MSLWPFGQGQFDNFQPKGVCLVWNLKYKRETPEYVFTSESPLVTARHVHCMYKDIYDSYLDHMTKRCYLGSQCSTQTLS